MSLDAPRGGWWQWSDIQEMLAQAWSDGWQAGNDDYDQGTNSTNPYRT